ncbi:aspartate/glutamate racemase family protein [Alterisphingorhabdus coralli]|uniref:Amino acid racemase n=1 Tax=Alterisphingorhabdus coralli TaxID=3071408 RepID=A0AA97F4R0_9SPHN|nr:amino acid racemase [Parasphingorhabdus sp. SCSIO 66989]WOE74201.1 amino acid racemase [Parasphingorhabdus sp. SCSIO 66989]
MRKIGLIGGMSWASTEIYYRHINMAVQKRAGGMCSGPIVMESHNFCDLSRLDTPEQWRHASKILSESAKRLEQVGATAILICANSMHKVYDDVADAVSLPIIHIADCVGEKMQADGIKRAALIGTRNVMTEGFYRQRLVRHGIKLIPPNMERVEELDRIIYEELMLGQATRDAERTLKTFLTNIEKEDVEAVVLGCTELEMIVNTKANVLPIYDGTKIHADAAVEWILGEG